MSKNMIYMISPADEGNDEIVCELGYEVNFPNRTFTKVIDYDIFVEVVKALEFYADTDNWDTETHINDPNFVADKTLHKLKQKWDWHDIY